MKARGYMLMLGCMMSVLCAMFTMSNFESYSFLTLLWTVQTVVLCKNDSKLFKSIGMYVLMVNLMAVAFSVCIILFNHFGKSQVIFFMTIVWTVLIYVILYMSIKKSASICDDEDCEENK